MARSLNRVTLIGHLGADPELRYFASGDAYVRFTLATSESWKDKTSGEPMEHTEWHRCFAARRLAEVIGDYLHKGSKVYIEGKLKTRSFDKEGTTHYITEIEVREMMMLDGRAAADGGHASAAAPTPRAATRTPRPSASAKAALDLQAPPTEPDFDDDIPF
jgi:single-strand DNA-binding protein